MHDVRSQVGIDLASSLDSEGKFTPAEQHNQQLAATVKSMAKAAHQLAK